MDFLSYSMGDRGSVLMDEIELPIDVLARSKNLVKNLDMKDLCDFDKNMLALDGETVDGMGFLESTFPRGMRKSVVGCLGVSSDETDDGLMNKVTSTSIVNLDHFTGFSAGFSSSGFKPNHEKESIIYQKLAKCSDSKEVSSMLSSEESLVSSLAENSLPAKRARNINFCPQIPVCQVDGCYKDLSSSKDYHKRHRVCDVHSKTAKVFINGIERRFCQQCSRFHLLLEFDDGKRSCRKRLAGHNERRRKPQLGAHLGSRLFGMTLLKSSSFLSPQTLSGGFFCEERFVNYKDSKHMKLEQGAIDISQLAAPANVQSRQKSLANLHVIANQTDFKTCNDVAVELELPMLSEFHCALSLLSAKSHKPSSHSAGNSMTTPSSTRQNQEACIVFDQKSTTQLGTSTIQASAGKRNFSSGVGSNSAVLDDKASICPGVQENGFLRSSDNNKHMHCISPEVGSTVDLLQLSSHLQRVEQLRNSMQMKQENYTYC